MNDRQTYYQENYQMNFWQIKESLKEFKNLLEKCFRTFYNASFKAEIFKYAVDIADFEEISLNEAKDKVQKTAEQLKQTLALSKQIANSEVLLNESKIIANFYKQITCLVNDNWLYILPSVKEELRKIYYKIDEYYQSLDKEVEIVIVTKSEQKINQKETEQEDLQVELEESFKNFFNSMQAIIEEEEITKYEIREADAAQEEAERDGYINWRDISSKYHFDF